MIIIYIKNNNIKKKENNNINNNKDYDLYFAKIYIIKIYLDIYILNEILIIKLEDLDFL